MKSSIIYRLFLLLFLAKTLTSAVIAGNSLEYLSEDPESEYLTELWATEPLLKTPESVLYDKQNDILYVSNVNGNPLEKVNNGFISKLSTEGDIIELEWITGLHAPKGMGLHESVLYVTDIDAIVAIDINKNKILNRYDVANAEFLNDIAIDANGNVYISDMFTGKIHKLSDNEVTTWLKHELINNPNGLRIDENYLLIGCSGIFAANLQNKELTTIVADTGNNVDGLVKDRYGNIYFSHWKGTIFKYDEINGMQEILSTSQDNIQSADMELLKDNNILLVPTFYNNRVVAYQLK